MTPAAIASPSMPIQRDRKGSFLIEASVSLFLLIAVSLVLLNGSFNILKPRVWTMQQNLVDAYLSQEVARMNVVDFSLIQTGASPWGAGNGAQGVVGDTPGVLTTGGVEMGLLPNFTAGAAGRPYTAQVQRLRVPIYQPAAVATSMKPAAGAAFMTPADLGIEMYELQTHVSYEVDGRTYVKSRTVVRSQ